MLARRCVCGQVPGGGFGWGIGMCAAKRLEFWRNGALREKFFVFGRASARPVEGAGVRRIEIAQGIVRVPGRAVCRVASGALECS